MIATLCRAVTLLTTLIVSAAAAAATIQGTASYRERIALPPDAEFEASVEDVSRADAAAEVIGRVVLMPVAQVPIRFVMSVDESLIQPGHRYSLRARISRGGQLLFTTDRIYPVLSGNDGNSVAVLMQRVSRTPPAKPDRTLSNTYWKLTQLNGTAVAVAPQQREPHLVLQVDAQRLTGSGGCNRLMGSYRLDGEALSFGSVASTMMACEQGMEQETAFFRALERVRAWRVHGNDLALLDEQQQVVARFVAVDLR